MPTHDIIVVGASAGGVEALIRLVAGLPPDLEAAVFVVVHVPPLAESVLPVILARSGALPAAHAAEGEAIRNGRIYVAPPDRHLVLSSGKTHLSTGPRENRTRPAIDPLFRSAAAAYGSRVVGVVLSGTLSDGTAGLYEIKRHGGVAVVQDPRDALFPEMPQSALDQVSVDYVLPTPEIAATVARLSLEAAVEKGGKNVAADEKPGTDLVQRDMEAQVAGQRDEETTVYVCPECGGTLWQVNAGNVVRFRCHVGHVYSADDLLDGYGEDLERSLWHAVRTLRDKVNLTRQLVNVAKERGATKMAAHYENKAREDEAHAQALEQMITPAVESRRKH